MGVGMGMGEALACADPADPDPCRQCGRCAAPPPPGAGRRPRTDRSVRSTPTPRRARIETADTREGGGGEEV